MNEILLPQNVDIVLYHHPCPDGFASALAAKVYMKKNFPEKEIQFVPCKHGRDPPDVKGKSVLICDFSFKKEILERMIVDAKALLILDHHETAEEALRDIPNNHKVFDMKKSGAYMTWQYFFPDEKIPLFIEYIQDRDLWTKEKPDGDQFVAWFYNEPFDFEIYEKCLDDDWLCHMIKTKGSHFVDLNNIYIKTAVDYAVVKFVQIGRNYYFVGTVNCTIAPLKSDVGNQILDKFPLCDFSSVFSIGEFGTAFSLRSDNYHTSVSMIAKMMGGGGHRNASGINLPKITNVIGDEIKANEFYSKLERIYFDKIEVEGKSHNVVYFNSSLLKKIIGEYLLQIKYEDPEHGPVQVCQAITHHHFNTHIDTVSMAAVYDYGSTNTEFVISFSSTLSSSDKGALTRFLKKEPSTGLKYPGVVIRLTDSLCPIEEYATTEKM
jgi:uncharacterized protein